MPAPVIAAGAVALAKNPKVQQFVKGAISTVANQVHQDNLFIGTRDKTFSALRANGFPESEWGAYTKNVSHTEVPDRKFGGTYESHYGPFYQKLFIDVQNYLNTKKAGMGDYFIIENQRIAMELPASERFKGSPWNAVDSAVSKYKNLNSMEILNMTDGLAIGQAFVGSDGQIKIPNAATAGEGVMSGLQNLGASLLSGTIMNTGIAGGGQIMSQAAAGISGQQQIAASSGGVVLTGGVGVKDSVTQNTTSGTGSGESQSGVLVVVALIAAALYFFGRPILRMVGIKM
jgi:hypothetical protein